MKTTRYIWLFVAFFALTTVSIAQELGCPTVLSKSQLEWLTSVQAQLQRGGVLFKKNDLTYVPVQLHVVGKNDGSGTLRPELVLEAICKLNSDFAPVGMYFYMPSPINYINDDGLWAGEYNAVFTTAADAKVSGRVNIYFHGFSATWCGVYFPNPDVVLVQNSCANYGSTTLTHEIGHFFSLPHTFSGWEGGDAPPLNRIEKVDGSNCRTAGDGFCDTGPDYVSSRWSCPLLQELTDPNQVKFRPEPGFYMNYASDRCHNRFSNEQIIAMQLNLTNRGIGVNQVDTLAIHNLQLLSPSLNDTVYNPARVTLTWSKVPGAISYLVQVARYQFWETPNANLFVTDTTTTVKVFGDWAFDWRVKPLFEGNLCGSFSSVNSFFAKQLPLGQADLVDILSPKYFPNPLKQGEALTINLPQDCTVSIIDQMGKVLLNQLLSGGTHQINAKLTQGAYVIQFTNDNKTITSKLLVW